MTDPLDPAAGLQPRTEHSIRLCQARLHGLLCCLESACKASHSHNSTHHVVSSGRQKMALLRISEIFQAIRPVLMQSLPAALPNYAYDQSQTRISRQSSLHCPGRRRLRAQTRAGTQDCATVLATVPVMPHAPRLPAGGNLAPDPRAGRPGGGPGPSPSRCGRPAGGRGARAHKVGLTGRLPSPSH